MGELYDEYDDPVQYAMMGWQEDSTGTTEVAGLAIGIVLSVQYANSPDNQAFLQALESEENAGEKKGSYIECTCLVTTMGRTCSFVLPNCVIMQGKSSLLGRRKGDRADFTEDIPNGCTPDELDSFFANSVGTDDLTGDRVIIGFVGGNLQSPVVLGWLPNPKNRKDAGTIDDGKRYLQRRNGTQLEISKAGNFAIAHEAGNYLQMRGERVTLKARRGQLVHMNEDGSVWIQDQNGNNITISDNGVQLTTGETTMHLTQSGLHINSVNGVSVKSPSVDVISGEMTVGGGTSVGEALLKESFVDSIKTAFKPLSGAVDPASAVAALQSVNSLVQKLQPVKTSVLKGD